MQDLTIPQFGIWLAQKLLSGQPTWNVGEYLDIRGDLDPDRFERALRRVAARTDSLWVRVVEDEDGPKQYVAPPSLDDLLQVIDLGDRKDPVADARRSMADDMKLFVDLEQGPVFGFVLFKITSDRWFWYARYHHFCADGVTLYLVANWVAEAYSEPDREYPPTSAFDLLAQEQAYRASQDFTADADYWRAELEDLPSAVTISGEAPVKSGAFLRLSGTMSREDYKRFASTYPDLKTPDLFMVATALYLCRLSGSSDLVVGMAFARRRGLEQYRVAGMSSGIVPVRLKLKDDLTLREMFTYVQRKLREVSKRQRFHETDIRDELGLSPDEAIYGAVVNTMSFDYDLSFGSCRVDWAENVGHWMVEDFSIAVFDRFESKDLDIQTIAKPESYTPKEHALHHARLLEFCARLTHMDPGAPVREIEALSPLDHDMLSRFRRTQDPTRPNTGYQRFEDEDMSDTTGTEIAILGMAGRFPEAADVETFWQNLREGKDCVRDLTDEGLRAEGVPEETLDDPNYVKRVGVLEDEDLFDAQFFDFNPREAELIDPQQRIFLEVAWEALERAAIVPDGASVGVYAGVGANYYSSNNLMTRPDYLANVDPFQVKIGMDPDFIATRVCYKLNLQGPGVTVQTACSTSLVAVHEACQALLAGACDVAVAGGVGLRVPQRVGAMHTEGGIVSKDGYCRAFDASATGTIGGNGAGAVVLKRLDDALADRDPIVAVIKATAINNDGSRKVGYTAPSVEGQSRVIRSAQLMADVSPDTIGYVETHGTGTKLGDPIEIAALTKAFREETDRTGYCAIASAKSAIGHLDTGAGIAGLIKAALVVERAEIPPSLHFTEPNPALNIESTPFRVQTALSPWKSNGKPRRAAVSSFGIGGTNSHAILEEAPPREFSDRGRDYQILTVSAKTAAALDATCDRLADNLRETSDESLADAAYTLQVGRTAFVHRRVVVAKDRADAAAVLAARDPERSWKGRIASDELPVTFLFPGQGAQFVGMAAGLAADEPVFRDAFNHCADVLEPLLGVDLRTLVHPSTEPTEEMSEQLAETRIAQPALFAVEYALVQLWRSWSLEPTVMIGHSIGEITAATVAGVFALDDALALVAARGRLMQSMPRGAMLSVPFDAAEIEPRLRDGVCVAAENAPGLSAVSGPSEAIEALAQELEAEGVSVTRLHTSHAFHSSMMDPIVDEFVALVAERPRRAPMIPFISNRTGDWITDEQACDPAYWADHLRGSVRFAEGARRLLEQPQAFVEVGPGKTLATFLRRCAEGGDLPIVEPSLRHPKDSGDDGWLLARSLGKLWLRGVPVDWESLHEGHGRLRVALPTYAFQRRRYWVEPGAGFNPAAALGEGGAPAVEEGKIAEPERWFHVPLWQREDSAAGEQDLAAAGPWLALVEDVDDPFVGVLRAGGAVVTCVLRAEDGAEPQGDDVFVIDPEDPDEYSRVLEAAETTGRKPRRVLHGWSVTEPGVRVTVRDLETWENRAFFSLLYLARALQRFESEDEPAVEVAVLSNELYDVSGAEPVIPEKALIEGPVRVAPAELTNVRMLAVDVARDARGGLSARSARRVLADLVSTSSDVSDEPCVAYRGDQRWRRSYEPRPLPAAPSEPALRSEAVILITGGLGGIGLALAERFARTAPVRLVLLGRSELPERDRWDDYLVSRSDDDKNARTIRRLVAMEKQGAEILPVRGDIADREAMDAVLKTVRERFGALDGVIHSAGVAGGGLIQTKTVEDAVRVFRPKVRGVHVLAEALDEAGMADHLDFFAVASSLSAMLGGVGQVDYVAANSFLDAWARYRMRQGGAWTVSVNWDTWAESGMAVATATGDGPTLLRAIGGHDHPLLDRTVAVGEERQIFATDFAADSHWVLAEHQIGGVSLLPGTAYLELTAAALGSVPCRLEEISFLSPVFAPEEGAAEVSTFLIRREDGGWDVSIASRGDDRWVEYTRGRVRSLDDEPPAAVDLDALRARCDEGVTMLDPTQVRHGPHWRVGGELRHAGDGEFLAHLHLPEEYADEVESFVLHPSLMDAATSFYAASGEVRYLPVVYESLTLYRPLTATVWSHVRRHESTQEGDEKLLFDINLLDENGEVLVGIEGYTLRRIDDTAMRLEEGRAAVSARQSTRTAEASTTLEDGLLDLEGAEAFGRILADGSLPQVLVSTIALQPRLERYRRTTLADVMADSEQILIPTDRHPRPEISTEYKEPSSEEEAAVAEIWAEMLGLETVGVFDDFFELGGHSLLGIQINARIKDRYGVELAPGVIFERPTVELFAKALVEHQGVAQKSILEELAEEPAAEGASPGVNVDGLDVNGLDVEGLSESDLNAMLAQMLDQ